MAQSSTARTPESVKNELLMAKLLQQSAAANTGPYTSGGVTALKALSGLMGGLQERQAEQANAAGQAQSNAVLAAALKAYAANRNGAVPTFGDATAPTAAPTASTPTARAIPTAAPSNAPMSSDARDLAIRTIYGEAGGEPAAGQAGVASVLKNRLAGGQYGDDMQSVILAPKQFSLWNKGDPAGNSARKLDPSSSSYQKIGAIYDGVMSGQIPDPTGGATHYYNPNVASPGWGPKLAQQNDVRIGNHRFVGTGPAGPNGSNIIAQADKPAANAQPVASDTLPPGITPDMVSAPRSPFGAMPTSMAQPAPAGADPSALAAALKLQAQGGVGPGATPPAATVQPSSPFGAMPTSMAQTQPSAPDPALMSAPPPPPPPASPFGAPPSPMAAQPLSPNSQALATALRQSVAPSDAPLAGNPGTDAVTAPPLTVTPQNPLTNPTPMDQQGGIGGPAPSPQLLASVLKANAPLQGSSPMMPASAPMPPPGVQSGAQPDPAPIPMPDASAPPPPPAPAPDPTLAPGLTAPAMGPSDPNDPQSNAFDYAMLPSGTRDQYAPSPQAGGLGAAPPSPDMASMLAPPDPGAGSMLPVQPPLPPPGGQSQPPMPSPAPAAPPAALAQALRAQQPATSPAAQFAGDSGLPDTAPLPPSRPSDMALGLNPDLPVPNAASAGPAPLPPGLSMAQPLGLAGNSALSDPSSPQSFQRQQAQGPAPSVMAQALRQSSGMPAAAAQNGPSGGFDLGSLFGGGNPLSGLGNLFSGSQQAPSVMPTGTPASSVQQSPQPQPQGSGSGPMSFMSGLGGGLFGGGQQQPQAAPAVTGQAAIDAALADPRISDSIKMKLMEAPEHSYSIAPNGTMYDTKTGRAAGGNFEKPTPQQSVQTPDGRVFSFDPTSGSYKEGPSGSAAPTSDMRNYDAYAAQEAAAGRTPLSRLGYDTALKTAGKTEVNVNTKDENAEAAARGAARAKRLGDIADDGSKITDDTIKYQRLGDLLNSVNTGPKTAYLEKIRQSTGLTLDPKTDQVQALNAAIQQIVPTLHVSGSGSTSDRDQANFVQSLPTLAGSAGGNQKILDTLNGTLAYRQQRALIAQQYQDNKITAQQADEQINALPSPFAPKKDAPGSIAQPQVGAPDAAVAKPADKAAFDALPSGTLFQAPDGSMRRKP